MKNPPVIHKVNQLYASRLYCLSIDHIPNPHFIQPKGSSCFLQKIELADSFIANKEKANP